MRPSINGSLYKIAHLTEQAEIIELMWTRVAPSLLALANKVIE
jgi:hypothetical protein